MKRIVAALTACCLAATGCSLEKWGVEPRDTGKVHLTYALWDAYQQEGYQKSIDQFEKLHPNIDVTIEQIPYDSYQAKITAQYISGNAPDVFWVNPPFLGDWARGGLLADVSDRVEEDDVDLTQYYQKLVNLHSHGDKMYGLPKDWDTIALYYNQDFFEKVGVEPRDDLTWRPDGSGTFLPYLKRLTVDENGHNALSPKFDPKRVETYAMAMPNNLQGGYGSYLAMNGGSVLPKQFADRSSIDSPQNRETLKFLAEKLRKEHVVAPAGEYGENANGENMQTMFAQGRIAIYQAGDWNTNSLSQLSEFKTGVMPLPSGPKGRYSVFNGLTDGTSSQTEHPDEAWELVKWLGSERSQRIMGSGGYILPAIRKLDPLYVRYWRKKGIDVQPFVDTADGKTVNFPVSPGFGEGENDVEQRLAPTYLGTQGVDDGLAASREVLDHRLQQATE